MNLQAAAQKLDGAKAAAEALAAHLMEEPYNRARQRMYNSAVRVYNRAFAELDKVVAEHLAAH